MFELRDYQKVTVDKAIEFFRSSARYKPMAVLPTGSGKSIIIAYITKQLNSRVLVLQPSKELLEQNYKKYEAITRDNPDLPVASVYSASFGVKEVGKITFATIGSVHKKPELFRGYNIIIDECHNVPPKKNSMYVSFLKRVESKVLGLTATPFRLKSYTNMDFDPMAKPGEKNSNPKISKINLLNRERPLFFNKFLHVVNISEMYDKGYLCPINYISLKYNKSDLRLNSTGADYSEDSVTKSLSRNDILNKIPGILDQAYKKKQKSCLVFVKRVAEAKELSEKVPFSSYIHSLTPKKERARIIQNFKKGNIKTLFNVSVLTEGFDYPGLDTIILARPTMSLSLYIQMVGRGMRKEEGKDKCSVVDMCGNIDKFGKVEEIRVEEDYYAGWVLRNDTKILSGVRLDEL